jgi:hypothetical protein
MFLSVWTIIASCDTASDVQRSAKVIFCSCIIAFPGPAGYSAGEKH